MAAIDPEKEKEKDLGVETSQLWRLLKAVVTEGGGTECSVHKRWEVIAEEVGLGAEQHAGLKTFYDRTLLPYELAHGFANIRKKRQYNRKPQSEGATGRGRGRRRARYDEQSEEESSSSEEDEEEEEEGEKQPAAVSTQAIPCLCMDIFF